jgi:N-acetylglucosaminyl-diphospho-decaprenol L-rhamnosyltransferase
MMPREDTRVMVDLLGAPAPASSGPRPRLSSVIVSWNTKELLEECLQSLSRSGPPESHQVVVVDNGSTDGSAEMVRSDWPEVLLVGNERNLGYQWACNQGIKASTGDLVLLINADAWVSHGALDTMVTRMESDDSVGIVGPRLVYRDGSWQRWTAGRAPSLVSVAAFYLGLERVSRSLAARSLFLAVDTSSAFSPDWVSSACMLVRRSVLDEVGLLDERYLCYMDDVDLCERARAAKWQVWYEPNAQVVHVMGESTRRQTGASSPAAIINFNDYFRRTHGRPLATIARLIEMMGFGSRAAVYALRGLLPQGSTSRRQALAHARNARIALRGGHV